MSDRNGKIFCTSIASLSHISKIAGLVARCTNQDTIIVDLVGEDHFLNGQGQIGELGLEGQLRVGIENVALNIAIGKEDLLR